MAGAFMGSVKQWSDLKVKWRRRLKGDGLAYFRSTEYNSLTGQFHKYRDPVKYPKPTGSNAARQVRDDLDSIVKNSRVVGCAVFISLPLYRFFRTKELAASDIFSEDPFIFAIQLLFKIIADDTPKRHRLAFIVDESQSAQRIERTYLGFKELNPAVSINMNGLAHLDDKTTPPLQVADMMASVAKELFLTAPPGQLPVVPKRLKDSIWKVAAPNENYLNEVLKIEKERRGLV